MPIKFYSKLAAIIASIGCFAYFAIRNSEGFQNVEYSLALLLLSISLGLLFYSPFASSNEDTETSALGTLGTRAFFNLVTVVWAGYVFYQVDNNPNEASLHLDVVTIVLLVLFSIITRISSKLLDQQHHQLDYRSEHVKWAAMLKDIAVKAKDESLSSQIDALGEQASYLARDSKGGLEMNGRIGREIAALSLAVDRSDYAEASVLVAEISKLFVLREREYSMIRSKV